MKKLTYLFLALIIIACSSDDSSDDGNQLFIEKYNGVVFEAEWATSDNTRKIAFLNTSEIRIYEYYYGDEVCYVYPINGTFIRDWWEDSDLSTITTSLLGQTENSITIQYNIEDEDGDLQSVTEYSVTFDGDVYRLLFNDGQDPDYISTDDELCF
ncbi:hypothetical protein N8719_04025 [Flavobacteriaceae bacterium]|nr:hypothetical protein [Flavobacteriaceae bacterium]